MDNGYWDLTSDYCDLLSRRQRSVAVLPKRSKEEINGRGYKLPKSFKGVATTAANSIEQLKRDAETRPGKEVRLKDGEAVTLRFLHEPIYEGKNASRGWHRFDEHYVREGKSGAYVPCIGEGCPLDGDPNARSSRKWLANVLDVGTGEVRLLKMTKDTVDKMIIKFERSASGGKEPSVMRRNYTVIRVGEDKSTKYEIENEDAGPVVVNGRKVKLDSLKLIDIKEELNERVRHFFGGATKSKANVRSLDEDDDEDEEDLEDEFDEKEEPDEEEDEEAEEEDGDEDDDEVEDDDEDDGLPPMRPVSKRQLPKAKKKVRR